MSERGQMGPTPRWPVVIMTSVLVAIVVLNHLFDAENMTLKPTPEAAGQLSLFHLPWSELLPVAGVVFAFAVVIGVVRRSGVVATVFRGGDGE